MVKLVVVAAVELPRVMLLESTLSFLGLDVPATTPSLGAAIARGYQVLFSGHWWVSVFPGLALMAVVVCVNLLGDWLRDVTDPRWQPKGRGEQCDTAHSRAGVIEESSSPPP